MKKSASLKLNRVLSAVLFALGIAVLAVFILFAIAPDAIAPYNPKLSFDTFLEPSAEHILGTNNLGYDILSELIHASRTTLTVGLLSALVCTFIGTIAGVVAGCAKGLTGEILNVFINFFIIIPMLPLAIVIGAYLSGGALDTVLTISLIGWCGTARAVKAKTEKVKNSPYVRLMRGLGFSRMRILFRHVQTRSAKRFGRGGGKIYNVCCKLYSFGIHTRIFGSGRGRLYVLGSYDKLRLQVRRTRARRV